MQNRSLDLLVDVQQHFKVHLAKLGIEIEHLREIDQAHLQHVHVLVFVEYFLDDLDQILDVVIFDFLKGALVKRTALLSLVLVPRGAGVKRRAMILRVVLFVSKAIDSGAVGNSF